MNTVTEYVAIIIGGLAIIAGFAYGIYDTYFRKDNKKDVNTLDEKNK